jgi:gluconokinase
MAIYMIMGVSGSGKSTVGKALAEKLACPYFEADDFHPAANKEKMHSGIPLTDEDRWPWLRSLGQAVHYAGETSVFSCSALKESYREFLRQEIGPFKVVYMEITPEEASKRVGSRQNHFMPATLVSSQFAALEVPKDCIRVDATAKIDAVLAIILAS